MYHRSNEEWFDNHLTGRDIDWIMGRENNENLLLRRTPATNRHRELWDIETGNYVTLGEFFRFGADWLSCFDLYRMYLTFPPFISKRNHSRSNTDQAQYVRNAQMLRNTETGRWGLPKQ